jgi:hypothetical protein
MHDLMLRIVFSSLDPGSMDHLEECELVHGLMKQIVEWQRMYAWGWHSPLQCATVQNSSELVCALLDPPYIADPSGDVIYTPPHLKKVPVPPRSCKSTLAFYVRYEYTAMHHHPL